MDVGTWDGRPSAPSWAATGAEHVAELVDAVHVLEPRERVTGERVMICYRSGFTCPGTVAYVREGEGTSVVVDDQYGGTVGLLGLFPPSVLRTLVAEQCVPAELVALVEW